MAAFLVAMVASFAASELGLVVGVQTVFDFMLVPFLVGFFARSWLRSRDAFAGALVTVAFLGAVLGVIATVEQITGQAILSPREHALFYEPGLTKVISLFGTPAAMTTVLCVTLPFQLYGIGRAPTLNRRLLQGLALALTLSGVFFTYVRAGWLGAVVAIISMLLLSRGVRRALAPLLPLLVVIGILVASVAVDPQIVQKRLVSERPISDRLALWQIAFRLFRGSPILGIGYGNYAQRVIEQFGWDPYMATTVGVAPSPHNTYLGILVSGGLVALIPYLAIFLSLAWRGRAFWRENGPGMCDLVAVIWATLPAFAVIMGTVEVLNYGFANVLLFFVVGASLGRLEQLRDEAGPRREAEASRLQRGDAPRSEVVS